MPFIVTYNSKIFEKKRNNLWKNQYTKNWFDRISERVKIIIFHRLIIHRASFRYIVICWKLEIATSSCIVGIFQIYRTYASHATQHEEYLLLRSLRNELSWLMDEKWNCVTLRLSIVKTRDEKYSTGKRFNENSADIKRRLNKVSRLVYIYSLYIKLYILYIYIYRG